MEGRAVSENKIMHDVMFAASKLGARIFRNNSGLFYTRDGRPTKAGLLNGASDLIGWCTVTITPEMVGKTLAVFTAIEVKDKGRVTPEQENFIAQVKKAGGIAGVARSPEDAVGLFDAFRP